MTILCFADSNKVTIFITSTKNFISTLNRSLRFQGSTYWMMNGIRNGINVLITGDRKPAVITRLGLGFITTIVSGCESNNVSLSFIRIHTKTIIVITFTVHVWDARNRMRTASGLSLPCISLFIPVHSYWIYNVVYDCFDIDL